MVACEKQAARAGKDTLPRVAIGICVAVLLIFLSIVYPGLAGIVIALLIIFGAAYICKFKEVNIWKLGLKS